MDQLMTKEESYVDRRELFKNIWETAMHIDAKEPDIMNKPKVIKTLRLDEVDRCVIGKRKKQRIKNLRTVCNKILDFCDRQDADDKFYKQMTAEGQVPLHDKIEDKPKKTKPVRPKKMVKRANSMLTPPNDTNRERTIASDNQYVILAAMTKKTSRNTSPIKIKRASVVKSTFVSKAVKAKHNAKNIRRPVSNNPVSVGSETATARRFVKKKRSHRRKISQSIFPPGTLEWPFE